MPTKAPTVPKAPFVFVTKYTAKKGALFIFDLDGTIALTDHRSHFVTGPKKDWPAFHAACIYDQPNEAVAYLVRTLYLTGCEIKIWTGRDAAVKAETVQWLKDHDIPYHELRMRSVGNRIEDAVLKEEWLKSLPPTARRRLLAVFEDRARVVAMWRANGLSCMQVAPGDF